MIKQKISILILNVITIFDIKGRMVILWKLKK